MRLAALALLASLTTAGTDSPRQPDVPPSQDFSHVQTTFDPVAGTWSVAYTFFSPPTSAAWGNLSAVLYTGASQCQDFQAAIASFQETPTLPSNPAISGTVIPPPDRMLRAAQSNVKTVDGNTITLTMTDTSFVGATPTCVSAAISHRGFLDQVGPLAFPGAPPFVPPPPEPGTTPPPPLAVAVASRRLRAKSSSVRVTLKPFNQAATGVVTLRYAGSQIARGSYSAKPGKSITVPAKLNAAGKRALKRHTSLSVTLTATAQAGTQVVTTAVRARVRP